MKIFSKYQDYYDSAAAYGVDDHIHWVRNVDEISTKGDRSSSVYRTGDILGSDSFYETDIYTHSPEYIRQYPRRQPGLSFDVFFIGFCGKIYPVIKIFWFDPKNDHTYHLEQEITYAYSLEDVRNTLKKADPKGKWLARFDQKTKKSKFRMWRINRHAGFNAVEMGKYFSEFSASDKYMDLFVRHNTPTFIYGEKTLWLAPKLKDYEFQRMMDPFAAYQEIEMFLSGILGMNDPDTVHIDDKHMAKQKGFDDWSFKKLPTKKR